MATLVREKKAKGRGICLERRELQLGCSGRCGRFRNGEMPRAAGFLLCNFGFKFCNSKICFGDERKRFTCTGTWRKSSDACSARGLGRGGYRGGGGGGDVGVASEGVLGSVVGCGVAGWGGMVMEGALA